MKEYNEIEICRYDDGEEYATFIIKLAEANVKTLSGHYLPKSVLNSALEDQYFQNNLQNGTLFVEMEYRPPFFDNKIDVDNICAVVKEVWWEENLLKGSCITIGNHLVKLIKEGTEFRLGIRGRDTFTYDHDLQAEVAEEPFAIFSWALVK
jgi:hypothetical protein